MARVYWSARGERAVLDWYRRRLADWQFPHLTTLLPTCQGETFVLSAGPESALPLLLLHGGLANSAMWLRSIPAWAAHHRVHAIDIIGDPGFSVCRRPGFRDETHALWLDDVWRGLRLEHAALVGASLGGFLALDYARRRPGRVTRLALIAPAGVVRPRLGGLLWVALLSQLGHRGRLAALQIGFGLRLADLGDEERRYLEFLELVQRHVIGRAVLPGTLADTDFAGLDMPLLVMLGGRDLFFDMRRARARLVRCQPRAEVLWFEAAGHAVVDPTAPFDDFLHGE